MRIVVTGSTSKIGINLINKLLDHGHEVIPTGGSQSKKWKLGQLMPESLQGDVLIHIAHDRTLPFKENAKFAEMLCKSFRGKKIFLSSLSAHTKTESKYGKSKLELEKIFSNSSSLILKAGIVYGVTVGGIFEKLNYFIEKLPVYPLPYKGQSLLFTTHIDDLTLEIIRNLEFNNSKTIFAANSYPISLSELLFQLAKKNNKKFYFLPLPKFPIHQIVKLFANRLYNNPILDSFLSLSKSIPNSEIAALSPSILNFRTFDLNNL